MRILLCATTALSVVTPQAMAQASATDGSAVAEATPAATAPEAEPQAGEIIVTAQKRSQRIGDVGATITVANDEQLKTAGITDVGQLSRIVPGLTTATSFLGYPVFSVRGVNFNATQLSASPAISIYLDEAPLPFSFLTAGMLFDVDHVEVLKGPQGTLFGQNATGGSINVIAAKPTDYFKAGFGAEVDHFGKVMLEGHVSGPLSDQLRVRVAGTTTQFGAWQKGYYLNRNKNGDQNKGAARLLLDWTPTDRLSVSVDLEGRYDHGEQQQAQVALVSPRRPAAAPPGLIGYPLPTDGRDADFDSGLDTHARNRLLQSVVRIDYELGDSAKLTSISNYIHAKYFAQHDIDGTAIPSAVYTGSGSDTTVSQEFRLAGEGLDKKLNYVFGVNYQHDKLLDRILINLIRFSAFPPNAVINAEFRPENRAMGVFGNLDYEVASGLTLTGGVRYTDTKQAITGCSMGNSVAAGVYGSIANGRRVAAGLPVTTAYATTGCINIDDTGASPTFLPSSTDRSQKESNVSWRAGLNYKPSDRVLLYGLVSRGFKAGTYPVQGVVLESQIRPVKQERLTSYEIGAKGEFWDRRLTINGSAFYYQYVDKQFYTFVQTPIGVLVNTIVNIPKSSVKGIDLDMSVTPAKGLTLRAAMTYIDTEIGQFQSLSNDNVLVDYKGSEFNFAPPVSATFDAEYQLPVGDGLELSFGGGGLYNARTFADLGEVQSTLIPAYTVYNARIGLQSAEGWKVSLWARNLTNKYYWTDVGSGGDTRGKFAGLPRTVGISASFSF